MHKRKTTAQDSSYPTIRTHVIAFAIFVLGMCVWSGFLTCCTADPSAWLCLGATLLAFFSFWIADKLARRLHRERFVRVPRYSDSGEYNFDDEKPKRG